MHTSFAELIGLARSEGSLNFRIIHDRAQVDRGCGSAGRSVYSPSVVHVVFPEVIL